jgi:hypothetical protein
VDPRKVLLATRDVDARVRAAGERALRETIGATGLAVLLADERRAGLGQAVRERAQQLLDAEDLGVRVASVQVNDVQMPASVQPVQRDMTKAAAERASGIDAARAYAATVLPKAKGEAERLVHEAQVARAQVVAAAEARPRTSARSCRLPAGTEITPAPAHRDHGVDPVACAQDRRRYARRRRRQHDLPAARQAHGCRRAAPQAGAGGAAVAAPAAAAAAAGATAAGADERERDQRTRESR